jgi:Fe-S-cluster containining protein
MAQVMGGHTRKEGLWLSCAAKSCCSYYTVYPSGADIWRIATTLQILPWEFTEPVPAEASAPDGFMLDATNCRFRAALRKQEWQGSGAAPCAFLLRLYDGAARCGLGDLRPAPCHTFPSFLVNNTLCLKNDGGCTCRRWALTDIDIDEERNGLVAEARDRRHYMEVVHDWNAFVQSAPKGETYEYPDFCRYLLDAYALRMAHAPIQ